jgi:hypothetical protein
MSEESQLAKYQDALLSLLSSRLPQAEILKTLETDPRFEDFRQYVAGFDPDMVAVACELMGTWAKKK